MDERPDESQPLRDSTKGLEPSTEAPSSARTGPSASLSYESALDRRAREPQGSLIKLVIVFSVAFVAAAGGILYVTSFLYMAFTPGFGMPGLRRHAEYHLGHLFVAGIYGLLIVRVFRGLIRTLKTHSGKAIRRWEVLGALLGAGMALLIGGLCFGVG